MSLSFFTVLNGSLGRSSSNVTNDNHDVKLSYKVLIQTYLTENSVYIDTSRCDIHSLPKIKRVFPLFANTLQSVNDYKNAVLSVLLPVLILSTHEQLFMSLDRQRLFNKIMIKVFYLDVHGTTPCGRNSLLILGSRGIGKSTFLQVVSSCVQLISRRVIAIVTQINQLVVNRKLLTELICDAFFANTGEKLVANDNDRTDLDAVSVALFRNNHSIMLTIDDFQHFYMQNADKELVKFSSQLMLQIGSIVSFSNKILLILCGNGLYLHQLVYGKIPRVTNAEMSAYRMYHAVGGNFDFSYRKLDSFTLSPITDKTEFASFLKSLNVPTLNSLLINEPTGTVEQMFVVTGGYIRSVNIAIAHLEANEGWDHWIGIYGLQLFIFPPPEKYKAEKYQALQIALVSAILQDHRDDLTSFNCLTKIRLSRLTDILNFALQNNSRCGLADVNVRTFVGQFNENDFSNLNEMIIMCDEMYFSITIGVNADEIDIGFCLPYHFRRVQYQYLVCTYLSPPNWFTIDLRICLTTPYSVMGIQAEKAIAYSLAEYRTGVTYTDGDCVQISIDDETNEIKRYSYTNSFIDLSLFFGKIYQEQYVDCQKSFSMSYTHMYDDDNDDVVFVHHKILIIFGEGDLSGSAMYSVLVNSDFRLVENYFNSITFYKDRIEFEYEIITSKVIDNDALTWCRDNNIIVTAIGDVFSAEIQQWTSEVDLSHYVHSEAEETDED